MAMAMPDANTRMHPGTPPRRRMSGLGLTLQRTHDTQGCHTPPPLATSFEWHLEGFDCTVPGATSSEEFSPFHDPANPMAMAAPASPATAMDAINYPARPASDECAFHPSSGSSWDASVPSNAIVSDGQEDPRSSRTHWPFGPARNLQRTTSEHPPSILARPSSGKASAAAHPRFHEVRRPRTQTRRAVSDYAGSRGNSPRPSSPGMHARSRSMGGARETCTILRAPATNGRQGTVTPGLVGPSIRFADRPAPSEPNGRVQFVAPYVSSRPTSRSVSRGSTAGNDSSAPMTRRRTLQFADTPHDRIEWHERDMRPQCSTSSECRTASTGDARSHPTICSMSNSSVGGSRSAGSSPWVRPSSRLEEPVLSDSDADANCIFMEGLESLAALEEKQALQEQRLRAWRARTGSGSNDLLLGRPSAEPGVSLRQQRANWEALLADLEQPVEDDSDYQAQTESLPSGAAIDPNSNSSDDQDLDLTLESGSSEEGGNEAGQSCTFGSSNSLSLARIRSAGTPPPGTARPGSSASLPSPRLGRPHRRSWNDQTKIDLDRADFGAATVRRQALRRTMSVPPKLALGAAAVQETARPRHLRFMSPPRMLDQGSPSADTPPVNPTVTSTSGKALVKSPSPIASPIFTLGLISSPQPSPKPILRKSVTVSRPSSAVSVRAGSGPISPRLRPPVRQATVHLSSPFLAPADPDESVSTDESASNGESDSSPSDEEEEASSDADEGVYSRLGWSPRSSRGMTAAANAASPHCLSQGQPVRSSIPHSRSPYWDTADPRRSPRRQIPPLGQRAGPRLQVKSDGTTHILPRVRALFMSDGQASPASPLAQRRTLPRSQTQHPPSQINPGTRGVPLASPLVRPSSRRPHPRSAPLTPRLSSGLGLAAHSPPALPSVAATPVQVSGQVYSPASPLGLVGQAHGPNPTLDDFMDWNLLLPAPIAPFHHEPHGSHSSPVRS